MPALHGAREDCASQLPGRDRRKRPVEEDPDVTSFAGTRALAIRGDVQFLTRFEKRQRVVFPRLLVEIRCQKPAGLVRQERVDSDRLFAEKMTLDYGIRDRKESTRLALNPFSIFQA